MGPKRSWASFEKDGLQKFEMKKARDLLASLLSGGAGNLECHSPIVHNLN
jgi:hypothetical protein